MSNDSLSIDIHSNLESEYLGAVDNANLSNNCSSSYNDKNPLRNLPLETGGTILPLQVVNEGIEYKQNSIRYSKQMLLKSKLNKYRLIRKSPLKGSPAKSLSHLLIKHKKVKSKGLSSRKLKFILPKQVTKFSPRKLRQPRVLKSKVLPLIYNDIKMQHSFTGEKPRSNQEHYKEVQTIFGNSCIEEKGIDYIQNFASEQHSGSQILPQIGEDNEENDDEDLEDPDQHHKEYLAAFLKASSTIASQKISERKVNNTTRDQKLTKQQRRLQDRITALCYSPNLSSHQDALVLGYLNEVKDALASEEGFKFNEFIAILNEVSNSSEIIDVYNRVIEILKGFPDLQDGFAMFLKREQAVRVGKYSEYSTIEGLRSFACELKHHLSRQPQNLQKVLRILQSVANQPNVDSEQVLFALTPLFKLQPWLLESLSKCIPTTKPQCSLPDDFEEINMDSPSSPDGFERISLPDDDGKGTAADTCSCECHASNNLSHMSSLTKTFKSDHCFSCALRFIDGRVFLQCGKTLRLAKVTYITQGESEKCPLLSKGKNDALPKKEWRQPSMSKNTKMTQKSSENIADGEKPKKGRKSKKNYNHC